MILLLLFLLPNCILGRNVETLSDIQENNNNNHNKATTDQSVDVKLKGGGTVTGFEEDGVQKFLGIPYAQPPVGPMRFKDAEPVDDKADVDATELPNICMQPSFAMENFENLGNQSENCLYLNIYTPDVKGEYPVMFFIHGGAFVGGSANQYDGTMYAKDHGLVMVATNYRLGTFGFLYDNDTAPGSMGLKDQWLALSWVNTNIKAFGGDPDAITIFGESAGSGSVSHHVMSPKSKGLFVRAMMESGTVLCGWDYQPPVVAKDVFDQITKDVCTGDSKGIECLRSAASEDILKSKIMATAPTLDGTFVVDDPEVMVKAGRYNDVDMVIGFNSGEGWMFLNGLWHQFDELSDNGTNSEFVTTNALYVDGASSISKSEKDFSGQCVVDAVVQEYSQWSPPTTALKRLMAIGDLASDFVFRVGIIDFAKYAVVTKKKVYVYEFTYVSNYSMHVFGYRPQSKWMGALHASELAFVFGRPLYKDEKKRGGDPDAEDVALATKMMKIWTDFGKNG